MIREFQTLIVNLRVGLGDENFASLLGKGEAMTMATIAAYAHDQIDRVRGELEQLG